MAPRFRAEELTEHHEFLRALARRLVRDADRAEDLVQDAYVVALERPPRSGGALRSWLAQVVKRHSLNAARADSRRAHREESVARESSIPSHEEVSEHLEISGQVIAIVQRLPETQRWALYRRHFDGRSVKAIAMELGVSPDTVKTRLRRALDSVRPELDARVGGDRSRWLAALLPLAVPPPGIGLVPATKLASLPTGTATGSFGVLGGVLLMKKLVVAAGIGLLLFGAVYTSGLLGPAPDPDLASPPSSASALVALPADASAEAEPLAAPAEPESPRRAPTMAQPSPARTTGELVVHAIWETDGTPAAGVEVLVEPSGGAQLGNRTRRATTDAGGSARFADLLAGEVGFHGFRGGSGRATIEAGAETAAELAIPAGYDVVGVVVSPSGEPVPGAQVWIRQPGPGWLAGRLATTADDAGRFALRSVGTDRMIGARALGFGPSIVERLERRKVAPGEPVRLELALRGAGGAIEGTVVDSENEPVAGARVVVGNAAQHAQHQNGSYDLLAPPVLVVTDAAGRFFTGAVAAEYVELAAWSEGHPIARSAVEIEPGATARTTLRFDAPVVVVGTVRDASGEPLAWARVTLEQMGAGPYRASPFVAPQTIADAEGHYELGGLPAGELGLLARDPGAGAGEGRITLDAVVGDRLEADITVAPLSILRGRLVDATGDALAGWIVDAEGPLRNGRTSTGDDGSFQLALADRGPYRIGVTNETGPRPALTIVAEGVEPGGPELLLEVPAESAPSAFVTGRFEDRAGRLDPQERAHASLWTAPHSLAQTEIVDGAFRVGPVAPGTYTLHILAGSTMITSTAPLELAAGEELDVGTLFTEVPGSIVIDVAVSGALRKPLANVQLVAIDYERVRVQGLTHKDGGFVATEVGPGPYQLLALESEVCVEAAPFTVRPGEETVVHATARPGAFFLVELSLPDGAAPIATIHIVVTSPEGEVVLDYDGPPQGAGGEVGFARAFPLGTSKVAFTTGAGLSGSCEVDVAEADIGEQKTIVLELE